MPASAYAVCRRACHCHCFLVACAQLLFCGTRKVAVLVDQEGACGGDDLVREGGVVRGMGEGGPVQGASGRQPPRPREGSLKAEGCRRGLFPERDVGRRGRASRRPRSLRMSRPGRTAMRRVHGGPLRSMPSLHPRRPKSWLRLRPRRARSWPGLRPRGRGRGCIHGGRCRGQGHVHGDRGRGRDWVHGRHQAASTAEEVVAEAASMVAKNVAKAASTVTKILAEETVAKAASTAAKSRG